jgi:hypothetical protein
VVLVVLMFADESVTDTPIPVAPPYNRSSSRNLEVALTKFLTTKPVASAKDCFPPFAALAAAS